MGNKIRITKDTLSIRPTDLDKVWTFKGKLTFPLNQVVGATVDHAFLKEAKGVRLLGLATPNKWAGTFILQGHKSFYNVTSKQQVLVIQLKNAGYQRLILGVQNAAQLADKLNQAIEDKW